ncbi:MAG: GIDE domain-containing protein [Terriglobales bacterium]
MYSLLQFLDGNQWLLGGSAAAGLGLCFFFWGVRFFFRTSAAESISRADLRAATPGPATFAGTAGGQRTLSAPITGKECYVYRAIIWQQEPDDKAEWKSIAEETGYLTFLIEDSTGKISVEPRGAELDLRQCFEQQYDPSAKEQPLPERIATFMSRNGVAPTRPIRVEECCLTPSSPVSVTGTMTVTGTMSESASPNRAASAQLRETQHRDIQRQKTPPPEVVRLSSGPLPTSTTQMSQQAKIAAALSRAGLQTDIWTRAEVQAPSLSPISVTEKIQMDSRTAPSSTTPPNDATPEPSLLAECSSPSRFVIAKGSDDSRFLISNHNHPPNPRVDWKSALLVVAGSTLTVLGVWVLLLGHNLPRIPR